MSSTIITVLRCDRCGFEAEMRGPAGRLGWGVVRATETADETAGARPRAIGAAFAAGPVGDDICPGCATELFDWWRSPAEVAQPSPPAPPPAPSRPLFTIEDRKRLVPILHAALIEQVEETAAAYRNAPTTVLHPEVPPIAVAGVPDRALAAACFILEHLEVSRP